MVLIADRTRLNDRRADRGNDPFWRTNEAIFLAKGMIRLEVI